MILFCEIVRFESLQCILFIFALEASIRLHANCLPILASNVEINRLKCFINALNVLMFERMSTFDFVIE